MHWNGASWEYGLVRAYNAVQYRTCNGRSDCEFFSKLVLDFVWNRYTHETPVTHLDSMRFTPNTRLSSVFQPRSGFTMYQIQNYNRNSIIYSRYIHRESHSPCFLARTQTHASAELDAISLFSPIVLRCCYNFTVLLLFWQLQLGFLSTPHLWGSDLLEFM